MSVKKTGKLLTQVKGHPWFEDCSEFRRLKDKLTVLSKPKGVCLVNKTRVTVFFQETTYLFMVCFMIVLHT